MLRFLATIEDLRLMLSFSRLTSSLLCMLSIDQWLPTKWPVISTS